MVGDVFRVFKLSKNRGEEVIYVVFGKSSYIISRCNYFKDGFCVKIVDLEV